MVVVIAQLDTKVEMAHTSYGNTTSSLQTQTNRRVSDEKESQSIRLKIDIVHCPAACEMQCGLFQAGDGPATRGDDTYTYTYMCDLR